MGEVEIGNEMETWNMDMEKEKNNVFYCLRCPLSENIIQASYVEVRARVFFELMEGRRWNFASCCLLLLLLFRLVPSL